MSPIYRTCSYMGHLVMLNSLVTPKHFAWLNSHVYLGSLFFFLVLWTLGPCAHFCLLVCEMWVANLLQRQDATAWSCWQTTLGPSNNRCHCMPRYFFFFFCSSFPNYNAFLYLFKLQTYYYYCEILPLRAVNKLHWGQTMTDTQVSFFFVSFLFLSFFN